MTTNELAAAEAELTAAWLCGDAARAEAAEARVNQLAAAQRTEATLHQAALWYAEQGLKVFPLQPGSKIPFPRSHGCLDASSMRDVVDGWWETSPDANIGIATGHLVDVVDVDGHPGQVSRAKHWDDIFGRIEADQVAKVLTPRPGGMHIYVPATGEGNGAGIVPGVDYRGKGGYVVAPPSVIAPGGKDTPGRYQFLGTPRLAGLTQSGAA